MHSFSNANSLLPIEVAAKMLIMGVQQLVELIESGRVDAVVFDGGCFVTVETVNELSQQRAAVERGESAHRAWGLFGAGAS